MALTSLLYPWQYTRFLAKSFNFTIPKCGSWIFSRNCLLKSLGTMIWPSTAFIPSTICSVNLYGNYGLTSSGTSDWLSGQPFWITVVSFISVSSGIICSLIVTQSTLTSLWIPRSAICRSNVESSLHDQAFHRPSPSLLQNCFLRFECTLDQKSQRQRKPMLVQVMWLN